MKIKINRRILAYFLIVIASLGIVHGVVRLSFGYLNSVVKENDLNSLSSSKKVLYISSYDNTYEEVKLQVKGLRTVLDYSNISLEVQYMDMINFNTASNLELFYQMLSSKHSKNYSYDAIITGDDFALTFVLDHQEELFSDIPIFFLGITNERTAFKASLNPYVRGFLSDVKLKDTIDKAIEFNPNARTIFAIYDDSSIGIERQMEFFRLQEKYPGYIFRGIDTSNYSREGLEKVISILDTSSILIYLNASEDKDGKNYSFFESAVLVVKNSRTPVYTDNIAGIGNGFVGGKVLDFEEMGKSSGNIVKKLVEGKLTLANVPAIQSFNAKYLFDRDVMQKFGITGKKNDEDSIYLNKARTFWLNYSMILGPFVEIFIFFLILILIMVDCIFVINRNRRQIEYTANHDILTGLYNRYYIVQQLKKIRESKKEFSVLLVDLDDFRAINDFNSYECGDAVLKELAHRLNELTDEGKYLISRYDGDNFLLIYQGGHLEQNNPDIFFIRQLLSTAIEYGDKTLFVFSSIGVVNSSPLFSLDDYLANADIALNSAKKQGKNKCVIFTDDMKQLIKENAGIGTILEESCKNEDLTILYQPQIDVQTGEIYGYEALTRLSNDDISPATFIPIAEKDGHIAKIGRIVTEKVLRQMANWRDCGLELHKVSINFSVGQAGDKGYIPFLKKLMRTYDIPAEMLGIEITESLFLENKAQATELFTQFDDMGLKIALDDFGTGYSSLNYLTYLPIHIVKLDKSTVDTYLSGQASFIENIVNLVHSLGMKIVVEGVEEKWQYNKLKSINCDYIQGYFFSKPLTGEEIKSFSPEKV